MDRRHAQRRARRRCRRRRRRSDGVALARAHAPYDRNPGLMKIAIISLLLHMRCHTRLHLDVCCLARDATTPEHMRAEPPSTSPTPYQSPLSRVRLSSAPAHGSASPADPRRPASPDPSCHGTARHAAGRINLTSHHGVVRDAAAEREAERRHVGERHAGEIEDDARRPERVELVRGAPQPAVHALRRSSSDRQRDAMR